jgi:hypothetical protein
MENQAIEGEGGSSEGSGSSDEGEDFKRHRSGFIGSMKEF